MAVGESAEGFAAIGCAYDVALGALYALFLADYSGTTEMEIKMALLASEKLSAGVRAPFHVLSSNDPAEGP